MLKKLSIFFFLVILVVVLNISKERTQLVYNEVNNNEEITQFYLLFENNSLNTNNFEDYLKDVQVLKIYPYINPVYASRIKANYSYSFTKENHTYDLERFKNNYIEKIKTIGLIKEAMEYQTKGVIINKVLIYANLKEIKTLLQKYPYIKYSSNLNGIYNKF